MKKIVVVYCRRTKRATANDDLYVCFKTSRMKRKYPRQLKMFLDFLKNLFELEREKKKELDITIGQHTDNVTYYLRCNT